MPSLPLGAWRTHQRAASTRWPLHLRRHRPGHCELGGRPALPQTSPPRRRVSYGTAFPCAWLEFWASARRQQQGWTPCRYVELSFCVLPDIPPPLDGRAWLARAPGLRWRHPRFRRSPGFFRNMFGLRDSSSMLTADSQRRGGPASGLAETAHRVATMQPAPCLVSDRCQAGAGAAVFAALPPAPPRGCTMDHGGSRRRTLRSTRWAPWPLSSRSMRSSGGCSTVGPPTRARCGPLGWSRASQEPSSDSFRGGRTCGRWLETWEMCLAALAPGITTACVLRHSRGWADAPGGGLHQLDGRASRCTVVSPYGTVAAALGAAPCVMLRWPWAL